MQFFCRPTLFVEVGTYAQEYMKKRNFQVWCWHKSSPYQISEIKKDITCLWTCHTKSDECGEVVVPSLYGGG